MFLGYTISSMKKSKLPKNKKNVDAQKASKPNRFVVKEDLEDAEESEGKPVSPKKKKDVGIISLKHREIFKKAVIDRVGKSGKKKSLYQIMIDAGYSESYAASGNIKKKKSWQALIEERLHEDKLSNIHAQLLVAKRLDYMLFSSDIEDEDIYELLESVGAVAKKIVHGAQGIHVWFWYSDNKIRKDALELAYKVLGKFAPDKFEVEQTGLRAMSDQELADLIKRQKARFMKKD